MDGDILAVARPTDGMTLILRHDDAEGLNDVVRLETMPRGYIGLKLMSKTDVQTRYIRNALMFLICPKLLDVDGDSQPRLTADWACQVGCCYGAVFADKTSLRKQAVASIVRMLTEG